MPAMVCPANADLPIREDWSSGEIGESGWARAYMKDCLAMNGGKAWDMAWGVSDARPVEKRESVKSPEGGSAVLKTSRTGGKAFRTRAWRGTVLPIPEAATVVMLIASGLVAVSVRVIRRYRAGLR